ncbi:hypothetical protein [Novosphingobium sp. TCA1]|uniref:hypothetical protein n=1 Tax=Novosphingobium sp. TCA1 TaxID=2682474 RepID=UPI0013098586|nr:hypothetical protein [Novosphingobium sp. TCA1]GFE77869.1 hypothetical protein NTCA1_55180 [Novosphingobium sp. TCA1]
MTLTGTRPIGRSEFIGLIAALMALNSLAIDIMLPALPAMGKPLGDVAGIVSSVFGSSRP